MKAEDLYEAIGDISDELLEESEHIENETGKTPSAGTDEASANTHRARVLVFRRLAAAAACLLLIGGGYYGISHMRMGAAKQTAESTMAVAEAVPEEAPEAAAAAYEYEEAEIPEAADEDGNYMFESQAEAKDAGARKEVAEEAPAAAAGDEDAEEMAQADDAASFAAALDSTDRSGVVAKLLRPDNNAVLLPDDGDNHALSPVNIAMALSLLSETTDGETRQQILSVLGVSSVEELRETAAKLLSETGYDDENGTALLANSLWLRDDFDTYDEQTLKELKDIYAADEFTGEMGSKALNDKLHKWLDDNTGKLLTQQAQAVDLDPETMIALASTIYYKANWITPFEEAFTKDETFHAPSGDREVPTLSTYIIDEYYRGEHFGAARLSLTDGNSFWFLLPDEGYSVSNVTSDAAMMRILQDPYGTVSTPALIDLQFPKFDISSGANIKEALQAMGMYDVFDPEKADFTPLLADTPAAVSSIEHAARVAVDEFGVTAAAFTVVLCEGAAETTAEEVDMICDRPFVFAVTNEDGLIYFEGVVAEP